MHHFFVPPTAIQGHRVTLSESVTRQLTQVLRLSPGNRIVVLDNSGWAYTAELEKLGREQAQARIVEQRRATGEPQTQITLYQALLKGDRFEWVLQKGTELGVVAFVPLFCARNVVRYQDTPRRKQERWQSIIREAAEQSHRGRLPRLEPARTFAAAIGEAQSASSLALLAWEEETATSLRSALGRWCTPSQPQALGTQHAIPTTQYAVAGTQYPTFQVQPPAPTIHLLIGPEGGFTAEEVAQARDLGLQIISLGPRILRAETAGIISVAAILYELGDLG